MLALLISLWTISIILLIADSKTESTRWLAAICFFSGLGGLAVIIKIEWIPIYAAIPNPNAVSILNWAYNISASLAYYMAPYTLLIYSICYSDIFKNWWNKNKLIIKVVILLPPAFMYLAFPLNPFFALYTVLSIWVTPYVLCANFLLAYSTIREKQAKIKQQRFLTCVIIIPGTLMSLLTNYLLNLINIHDAYFYNVWIIVLQFASFIFFAIQQGALGVKVTLEKNSMDRTMRALTSGTALLNHTIKNEVLKISMCMNNIEHSITKGNERLLKLIEEEYNEIDQPEDEQQKGRVVSDIHESITIVNDSTKYLVLMINKIQNHVKDIVMDESEIEMGSIIDKAINMVVLFARSKNIEISNNNIHEFIMKCDGLHLQETFINILKNSIESIDSNGVITIDAIRNNKDISVTIKDNGNGIPKEDLPYVIDPFFSTKHRTGNFGLGLSYCYSVMQHHGGSLEISSQEGFGTTVMLNFPAKRVILQRDLLR